MIQRSQTIYLIAIIATAMVMLFAGSPYGEITSNITHATIDYCHTYFASASAEMFKVVQNNTLLIAHILLVTALSLICILMYKKRALQLRLVTLNFLLIILLYGSMYYQLADAMKKVSGNAVMTYTFIGSYPLIMLVFNTLAWRGIRKDINLLKSMDRLR